MEVTTPEAGTEVQPEWTELVSINGQDVLVPRRGVTGPTGGFLSRAGRPKGPGKQTRIRFELCELVFGAEGSDELKEMAAAFRKQFLAGTINTVIAQTLLHWWLGKPKETIDVTVTPSVTELSDEELGKRALEIAHEVLGENGALVQHANERMNEAKQLSA